MRMDSPFPEMYGCPEHWQSEAIFEAFVDVSGLVLNVAALLPVGTRAATYSGGGLHIYSRCVDEAGGARRLKPTIVRPGPRLGLCNLKVRSGQRGEGEA